MLTLGSRHNNVCGVSPGLHFDAVDAVFVLARPKGVDEYVHLAGRAAHGHLLDGDASGGSVVSVLTYSEARALATWTRQLGAGELEYID